MCILDAMSQRLLSAVNSACVMRWIPFLEYSAPVKDTVCSAVKDTVRLSKGYTQFAFAVDSHGYSVLVHVRWILKDYSALVSINFSKKN